MIYKKPFPFGDGFFIYTMRFCLSFALPGFDYEYSPQNLYYRWGKVVLQSFQINLRVSESKTKL